MSLCQLSFWQAIASTFAAIGAIIIVYQLFNEWWLSKPKVDLRFLLRKGVGIVYTATDGTKADNLTEKQERYEKNIKIKAGQKEVILYFCMENKGRILRNPILWFTLRHEFKIYPYNSSKYDNLEWRRDFKLQTWHNCAYFGYGQLPYLASGDVSMYPIIVDAPVQARDYTIEVRVAAENRAKNYKTTLQVAVTDASS